MGTCHVVSSDDSVFLLSPCAMTRLPLFFSVFPAYPCLFRVMTRVSFMQNDDNTLAPTMSFHLKAGDPERFYQAKLRMQFFAFTIVPPTPINAQ